MEFNPSALLKHENSSHDTSDFALEDGSTIKLYPNSTLFYPEHFDGDHRKVLLSGEAFFEVTKDTARPFLVVNHHNIIHVMGTSFLVRSFSKIEKTEINVMSGTVWVKEMKSGGFNSQITQEIEGIVLTANQKLLFDAEAHQLKATIANSPLPLPEESELLSSLKFNEEALRDILLVLKKLYGIDIKLSSRDLENCTFTGDLNVEDLFQKLDLICQTIGASYFVEHTHVTITGEGCYFKLNIQ